MVKKELQATKLALKKVLSCSMRSDREYSFETKFLYYYKGDCSQ